MMKKNLLIFIVLGLMVGCASTQSSDDGISEVDDSGLTEVSNTPPSYADAKRNESKPEPLKPVQTAPQESNALADAIKTGQDEVIAKAALQILAQNPNDPKALNALGFYHYKKAHYPAALLMFDKALKVNPNMSEAYNNIGLVQLAQKEKREAILSFRKAMELNSSDISAAANLGSIYIENKDYNKALVALEMAYKKKPKDQKILNNYGIALTAKGKYSDARDMYKRALEINGSNKEVMLNYAILLIDHLKQSDEGLDVIGRLRFLGPSTEARNRINVLENKAKAGLK